MQLPFLRHISQLMSGRASSLPPAYQNQAGSRESTLCKAKERDVYSEGSEHGIGWQQPLKDSFTQVFLTPVDMTKLKMVENCLLTTPFQKVRLNNSSVFVPLLCPDVALSPQGPQRALKG